MNLLKFTIFNHNEAQQSDERLSILLNTDHIISVKPIKLTTAAREVIDGYWIRLTNGKKYKAIQIPVSIKALFSETLPQVALNDEGVHEINIQ